MDRIRLKLNLPIGPLIAELNGAEAVRKTTLSPINLTHAERQILGRLVEGLKADGARCWHGRRVETAGCAVRWLLQQIGDEIERGET